MSREGAAVNKVLYDAALWREHDGWVTYKCNVEQMPRYAMLEAYGSPPIEKAIQAALDAAYAEGLREAATVWEWTSENPTKPGWYWMRRLDIKSQPCGICQIRCWPSHSEVYFSDRWESLSSIQAKCEWAGPLPAPVERLVQGMRGM